MEKEVFSGKFFIVTVSETGYEQIHQRHGVTVFPITNEGKIRFVIKAGKKMSPLSAYIEPGEDPLACAKRELGEEMELGAQEWRQLTTVPSLGGIEKLQHFYIAEGLETLTIAPEPDANEKIVGTKDMSFEETKALIMSGKLDYVGAENCLSLLRLILAPISEN